MAGRQVAVADHSRRFLQMRDQGWREAAGVENRREWDADARFPERRARIGGQRDPPRPTPRTNHSATSPYRSTPSQSPAARSSIVDDPEVRLCRPGGSHERDACASDRSDLKRRGRRPATIARKLAAIAVYHRSMDHPTPTTHDFVWAVVRGTRRQLGVAAEDRARARRAAQHNPGDP
jgi:hypothetical protein